MEEKKVLFQISKSTFIRGKQCIKSLYLNKFHKNLRDKLPEEKKAIFKRGTDIGILAQQLFPGGIDATPKITFDYASAISLTKSALEAKNVVIYEAAFVYNEVIMAADIFVRNENSFIAYEVKSSTKVTDTYIWDAALQYYILKGNNILLSDFFIININNTYIKKGKIELDKIFSKTSVIKEILELQEQIEKYVLQFKEVLNTAEIPDVKIGGQCTSPYNCDFMGHCWENVPNGSVFELSNTNNSAMSELYYSGIKLISDIPSDYELSGIQKVQVKAEKEKKDIIDKEAIHKFLNRLIYPCYLIDFETFMPALPLFDNTHAFQHLPFQYSVHRINVAGEEATHLDFVAFPGTDPRKEFIEKLLQDIEGNGSVLVYNAQFEKSVLNSLKINFPEHAIKIDTVLERIVDLMEPFRKRDCYFLEMKGSHSIKNVLPAVFKELHYEQLAVSNGNEASRVYENLFGETDFFKIEETIVNLKEYCRLDTLAMVKILERFQQMVK